VKTKIVRTDVPDQFQFFVAAKLSATTVRRVLDGKRKETLTKARGIVNSFGGIRTGMARRTMKCLP